MRQGKNNNNSERGEGVEEKCARKACIVFFLFSSFFQRHMHSDFCRHPVASNINCDAWQGVSFFFFRVNCSTRAFRNAWSKEKTTQRRETMWRHTSCMKTRKKVTTYTSFYKVFPKRKKQKRVVFYACTLFLSPAQFRSMPTHLRETNWEKKKGGKKTGSKKKKGYTVNEHTLRKQQRKNVSQRWQGNKQTKKKGVRDKKKKETETTGMLRVVCSAAQLWNFSTRKRYSCVPVMRYHGKRWNARRASLEEAAFLLRKTKTS